jgi:iron(III) transport system substrate-binding protein
MQSDVFDGTAAVVTLKKRDMVAKYLPETAAQLPKEAVDANGYWAATNLFVITAAHNTDLVPRDKAPKTWDDLLAPQWKGKIVWPSTNSASAAAGFVGLVIAERGREAGLEFLKRLAAQNVTGVKASARQVLDQIVAGEFAIGLQMFNHATVLSAQKGAPVAWIPVNPALATPNVISLTANGPHPNAGKLFMDFALSREGQELFRDGALLTVHPQVAPMDATLMPDATRFGAIHFTPEKLEEELPAWQKIVEEIFR